MPERVHGIQGRGPSRWQDADLDRYRRTIMHAIESNPAKGMGPYQVASALREVFPRDTIATIDTGAPNVVVIVEVVPVNAVGNVSSVAVTV